MPEIGQSPTSVSALAGVLAADSFPSADELMVVSEMHHLQKDSELVLACEHIFDSGGKRLRPRLVLASSMTGDDLAAAVRLAAAAVELFHCASLAHDDVIDDATIRRGQETVATRFGVTTAALSGGWLFGRAAMLASSCGQTASLRFATTAAEVCDGQIAEVCDLFNSRRSEERYIEAIGGKTAALFELCTTLGAELASADQVTIERAGEYGWTFGIAFQVLDDVSDLLISGSASGKAVGKDLLQGVYTLPVIYAIEEAPSLRERLTKLSHDSLPVMLKDIRDTEGPVRAVEYATEQAALAMNAALDLSRGSDLIALVDEILISPLERILWLLAQP